MPYSISYHTFLYIPPLRYSLVPQILLSQLPYNRLPRPKNYFIVNHFSKVQTAFLRSIRFSLFAKIVHSDALLSRATQFNTLKGKTLFLKFLGKIPRIFLIPIAFVVSYTLKKAYYYYRSKKKKRFFQDDAEHYTKRGTYTSQTKELPNGSSERERVNEVKPSRNERGGRSRKI